MDSHSEAAAKAYSPCYDDHDDYEKDSCTVTACWKTFKNLTSSGVATKLMAV